MAALPNQRHEKFAQGIAEGKSATEAYEAAGYTPNDGNATRLNSSRKLVHFSTHCVLREAAQSKPSETCAMFC